jgi:hypothetical protein
MASEILVPDSLLDVSVKLSKLCAILEERSKLYDERAVVTQRALTTASDVLNRRLEAMNEWRQTMSDRDQKYMLSEVYDQRHLALEERVSKLEKLIYVGIGGILLLEFLTPVLMHFWK